MIVVVVEMTLQVVVVKVVVEVYAFLINKSSIVT